MECAVPVLWLTFHPDAPERGYWDQGFLERVFDGQVWRTRYEYEPVELRVDGEGRPLPTGDEGAVVVLPGSYNAPLIDRVNAWLQRLPWVVLFVTSDEESWFPVERLRHPSMVVYVEPDMGRLYDEGVRFLGMQCKADTHDLLSDCVERMGERPWDVFFAGQVTHPRRERCRDGIEACGAAGMSINRWYTDSFAAGIDRTAYLAEMAQARLAPCPSGPALVDSFRLWEALEAGTLPVADARREGSKEGYWHRAFGDPPFPILDDWGALPRVAARLLADWPRQANVTQAWWQGWQRRFVLELEDTIDHLRGGSTAHKLGDLVTVLVPSSPIESHPSLDVLNQTLDSVQDRLPGVEVIVGFDGIRPEQEKFRAQYDEYVRRALTSFSFERANVLPLLMPEWVHQANVTRAMLEHVRTPTVLFVEHDCPLIGDVPFGDLVTLVTAGEANVIRLMHEQQVLAPHAYLMLEGEPRVINGVPLIGTIQWSQRPHLASTAYYRHLIRRYFGRGSRTMIEDVMHGVLQQSFYEGGWGMDRVFIYAPEGGFQRSTTTDGRGSEPKFDMWIEYDGDRPVWGPAATRDSDEYKQPGMA